MSTLKNESVRGGRVSSDVKPARGTDFVHVDEKAYLLSEKNFLTPDNKARHRYQIILVNRGDELTEFRRDLGPRSEHTAMEFQVLGLWVHTVGELLDIADHLRGRPEEQNIFVPRGEDSNLWERYFDQQEQKQWQRRGKIIFGGN